MPGLAERRRDLETAAIRPPPTRRTCQALARDRRDVRSPSWCRKRVPSCRESAPWKIPTRSCQTRVASWCAAAIDAPKPEPSRCRTDRSIGIRQSVPGSPCSIPADALAPLSQEAAHPTGAPDASCCPQAVPASACRVPCHAWTVCPTVGRCVFDRYVPDNLAVSGANNPRIVTRSTVTTRTAARSAGKAPRIVAFASVSAVSLSPNTRSPVVPGVCWKSKSVRLTPAPPT